MDYKEEQTQELEVLESIYPDELEITKSEYPKIEFLIKKLPLEFIPKDSSSFTVDSINQNHFLNISFHYPEQYPDVLPEIKVEAVRLAKKLRRHRAHDDDEYDNDEYDEYDEDDYDDGEDDDGEDDNDDDGEDDDEIQYDDHGNPIASKLADLPSQIDLQNSEFLNTLIKEKLPQQLEEDMLIGIPMIFNIVTILKEECEQYLTETLAVKELEDEMKTKAKEAEEQKKFQGTKVTPESFKAWRLKFRKEMGIDVRDDKRKEDLHKNKLSGKQIFEQGLAGADDDEENTEDALPTEE
ncbi:hypothetical protein ACO0QE_002710 [Hanseniaspora vineae]